MLLPELLLWYMTLRQTFLHLLLLPFPLSVYSRSRQFYCALHNGASRCYCNVNSVSTGAIKAEYGFYYPVTRSPLAERTAALQRHRPMAASWLYNGAVSNSGILEAVPSWTSLQHCVAWSNGHTQVALTVLTLLEPSPCWSFWLKCASLFSFEIPERMREFWSQLCRGEGWRSSRARTGVMLLPSAPGDQTQMLPSEQQCQSVTQYGLCTGFENQGREHQLFQPTQFESCL